MPSPTPAEPARACLLGSSTASLHGHLRDIANGVAITEVPAERRCCCRSSVHSWGMVQEVQQLEDAGARILGAGRKVPSVAMLMVESASSGLEGAPAENAAPAPGAMHSCRFSAGHG